MLKVRYAVLYALLGGILCLLVYRWMTEGKGSETIGTSVFEHEAGASGGAVSPDDVR